MQARNRFSVPAVLAVVLLPAAAWAQTPVKEDVQTDVQETRTGTLMFGVGVNSDAGLTGSIVLNERNFDILNSPLRMKFGCVWVGSCFGVRDEFKELQNDWVFQGAGQEFRIEAVPGTQLQRFSATFREVKKPDTPPSILPVGFFSRPLAD
jgi:outer membrane protein insertion porin family